MNCGYHVKKKPRDKKNKIQYSHTPHTLSIFPLTEVRSEGNQNIRTFILILNIIVTKTKTKTQLNTKAY